MSLTKVFINAEQAARNNFRINEDDYIGEDGLYRCGVCRKKKENAENKTERQIMPLRYEYNTNTMDNYNARVRAYIIIFILSCFVLFCLYMVAV